MSHQEETMVGIPECTAGTLSLGWPGRYLGFPQQKCRKVLMETFPDRSVLALV